MQAEYTSLIYHYLKKYQEDPHSRIFAPLAEAYRKAGLVDQAIEIAKEGLQIHSQFIGGKVALGRALFEKGLYPEVIALLESVGEEVPDNLAVQKLLAESFLILGHFEKALQAYKLLLYFHPQDQEVAQIVKELEMGVYETVSEKRAFFQEKSSQTKQIWLVKIEKLQDMLLAIERYRQQTHSDSLS